MTKLATTRYGIMECLDTDSVVSSSLLRYGEWAQLELDFISGLVRPGFVVLDVGAFLGTHTLALAAMVGPSGHVYSFEPRAAIRDILSRNVQRNGLRHVTVYPCALGDRTESLVLPLIDLESNSNFGGLALKGDTVEDQLVETIRVEKLDDLLSCKVDFIKLDAEGMEANVLAGALSLLAAYKPILFAECNDLEQGALVLRACQNLGYEVFGLLSSAYNSNNLRGEAENIFGNAAEASLVALPPAYAATLSPALKAQLAPLFRLDDLVLLLLHKAQYPIEVLSFSAAAPVLGMDYSGPLMYRLRDEVNEVRAALPSAFGRAQAAEASAQAAEAHAQAAEARAQAAEASAQAAEARAESAESAATLLQSQLANTLDARVRRLLHRLLG